MNNRKSQLKRVIALALCLVMVIGAYTVRLADLQLVNGAAYREEAERKISRTYTQQASRGQILDRYGRPLVSNGLGFSITFDYFTWDRANQNEVILRLCSLMRADSVAYIDTLPITAAAPFEYTYASKSDEDYKNLEAFYADQAAQKNSAWPKEMPDAAGLMALLRKKYQVADTVSDNDARTILGIRYEMVLREFSAYNNVFTFATNVNVETVSKVSERGFQLPGVTIGVEDIRQYNTDSAAHVLGRVGVIYKDEYAELKEQGYPMNAIIGKDGLEKAYESYLRGKDGTKAVETNVAGDVTGETTLVEPQPGNNVVLTLDLDLQTVAEQSLASTIASIKKSAPGKKSKSGGDAEGGAAVVLDVKSGGILACASYPTYQLSTFLADYAALLANPLKPMVNRAISSAYPPGSTFKPVTAVAALESGTVTPKTIIRDEGVYRFYASSGYTPACWIWNEAHRTHGNINVSQALKYSCNYFFFEASRLMGIDTLNTYAKKLGLGQKTGVELAGERAGNLAGPESRQKSGGAKWMPGETLSAAIGQSEQQFTPIQMANYLATILNGGTRYQPHFLKRVVNYSYTDVVEEYQPVVLDKIDLKASTVEAVKEGMRGVVTDDGTAASIFRNYPIAIGGKTGSAQTIPSRSAHGVFLAFAPYDDPQIVVFVIVEHGGSGGNVAPVARDIFDAYFSKKAKDSPITPENTLIP